MLYKVFQTHEEASTAEYKICQSLGLPKLGLNAKTGLPDLNAPPTVRYAIPKQIQDGRWVFPSDDSTGEHEQEGWWPSDE